MATIIRDEIKAITEKEHFAKVTCFIKGIGMAAVEFDGDISVLFTDGTKGSYRGDGRSTYGKSRPMLVLGWFQTDDEVYDAMSEQRWPAVPDDELNHPVSKPTELSLDK